MKSVMFCLAASRVMLSVTRQCVTHAVENVGRHGHHSRRSPVAGLVAEARVCQASHGTS